MPMDPTQGAAAMAGGGAPPPMPGGMPQGGQPQGPGGAMGNQTQVNEILGALKQVIPQVIDQRGYVDMDKLIQMWPQVSRVPFQAVLQLIQQNPEVLNQIVTQYGLAGIILQGRTISAEEMAQLGARGGR